jgi:hypothetical protein
VGAGLAGRVMQVSLGVVYGAGMLISRFVWSSPASMVWGRAPVGVGPGAAGATSVRWGQRCLVCRDVLGAARVVRF